MKKFFLYVNKSLLICHMDRKSSPHPWNKDSYLKQAGIFIDVIKIGIKCISAGKVTQASDLVNTVI